jgi:hypothetical protein
MNDGRMSFLMANAGQPLKFYENKPAAKRNWIGFRLVGTKSNRDGIGAEVVVKAGGRTQTALMDGATGYLAHGVLPLYFGLGDAKTVESVEVRWPSGAKQTAPGPIVPNHTIDVREVPASEK